MKRIIALVRNRNRAILLAGALSLGGCAVVPAGGPYNVSYSDPGYVGAYPGAYYGGVYATSPVIVRPAPLYVAPGPIVVQGRRAGHLPYWRAAPRQHWR